MTRKSTKRSLILSILSMALCLAMLIGSTYAWFSDEATTGKVTITAGNLDVEIVDSTVTEIPENRQIEDAKVLSGEDKSLFDEEKLPKLWEPGMMVASKPFRIANLGTLALQYKLDVTRITPEGSSALGRVLFKVAKAESWSTDALNDTATITERRAAWKALEGADLSSATLLAKDQTTKEQVEPATGLSDPLVIVLFWYPSDSTEVYPEKPVKPNQEDYSDRDEEYNAALNAYNAALKAYNDAVRANPDNEFNRKDSKEFKVEIAVNLFATQTPAEVDSFGDKYDNLQIPNSSSANQFLEEGKTLTVDKVEAKNVPVVYKGTGTVALASGVEIKNTDPNETFSVRLGGKTKNDVITLTGSGKILPPKDGGYGLNVFRGTTVTIEGAVEVNGIYLSEPYTDDPQHSTPGGKLIIKGGVIKGIVNINQKITGTDIIDIQNGDAVKDAQFYINDKNMIKIPSGYQWDEVSLGGGKMKLVKQSEAA